MKKAIIFPVLALVIVFSAFLPLAGAASSGTVPDTDECECEENEVIAYEIAMEMTMNFKRNGDAIFLDLLREFMITVPASEMKKKFPELYLLRKKIGKNASVLLAFTVSSQSNVVEVNGVRLLSLRKKSKKKKMIGRESKKRANDAPFGPG